MGQKDHAVLGPSSAKRWMKCTSSVQLNAESGIYSTNEAAEEGTLAHSVLEDELKNALIKLGHSFEAEA